MTIAAEKESWNQFFTKLERHMMWVQRFRFELFKIWRKEEVDRGIHEILEDKW